MANLSHEAVVVAAGYAAPAAGYAANAVSRTSGCGLSTASFSGLSPDEIRFHQAIESGSVSDLQKILKKITNSRDDEQRTPLHKAVTKADTEMVEYLIDNCGAESKYDFSTGSSITPIPTL